MHKFPQKRRRRTSWLWILIPMTFAMPIGYLWWHLLSNDQDVFSRATTSMQPEKAALGDNTGNRMTGEASSNIMPSNGTSTNAPPSNNTNNQGPAAPASLAANIQALGSGFDGEVGIVVQSLDDGWSASFNGDIKLPQQSLSKLWVAATVMDRIDNGGMKLSDSITLTTSDLSIFHQPVRKRILANGAFTTNVADLLRRAMTQSDNTANAALFRAVGGRDGIMRFFSKRKLDGITMAKSEKDLQMGIVGMEWQDQYSYGKNFWIAREKIPFARRMQNMGIYLTDPPDAATAMALANGLARLNNATLLSPNASAYLIDLMAKSKTGPKRLRGGLSAGWTMPHKTGTGQVLKLLATAYNDIGILKSPAGRNYAVVVMIGATNRPVPERQDLMQAVTRAVIQCETAALDGCQ